jgi:membrane protein
MSPDGPHRADRTIWERSVRVARKMVTEWGADRVPDNAASVAFYAVLSLLPAFLALAATLGPLDSLIGGEVAERVQEQVLEFLGTVLTSEADGTLDVARDLFEDERPGLLTFSLLLALWTVSRSFAALVRALDVVYDLDEHRSWFGIRATALALAIGSVVAAALMLVAVVVGPLLGTGEEIAAEVGLGEQFAFLWNVVRLPFAFLVLVLWAATIFHVAPDHHTPWRYDVPGAVLTGVLWLVFSGGLRLYIELAQAGNAVFGALGGALIVLLWLWLLSLAVLIGGELNQVLLDERAPVHGPPAPLEHAGEEQATDSRPRPEGSSDGVESAAQLTDEVRRVQR